MADVLNKKIWSTENVIKFCGFAIGLSAQFMLLKQEIRDNKTIDRADKQIINFRLNELEKCCHIERSRYAVLPKETKIEQE